MRRRDTARWWTSPRWLEAHGDRTRRLAGRIGADFSPELKLERTETLLAQLTRILGAERQVVSRCRAEVAGQLEDLGRYPRAQVRRQAVLAAHRHHLGDDHPSTLLAELWLGLNLRQQHKLDEASAHFVHVYEVRKRTLGPADPATVMAGQYLCSVDGDAQP